MNEVVVHKGRVNRIQINMGYDVSDDVFTSQIRSHPDVEATLLGTWTVTFDTDGTDGVLILRLDDTLRNIDVDKGYMDLKRVSGSESLPVFDKPLTVAIRETVTQ